MVSYSQVIESAWPNAGKGKLMVVLVGYGVGVGEEEAASEAPVCVRLPHRGAGGDPVRVRPARFLVLLGRGRGKGPNRPGHTPNSCTRDILDEL